MSEVQTPAAQATPTAAATETATPAAPAASTPASASATAEAKPQTATSEAQPAAAAQPLVYELKLPEGSTLDKSAIEKVVSFAKEKGLSPEVAQSVLEREHLALDSYTKGLDAQFKATQEEWVKQIQSDKEIGGEKFKENIEIAHRAVKRFADEEFFKALDASGFGNHPGLVKVFARVGKLLAEDKAVIPGPQAGGRVSMEEKFYGKQT
jgi:hypothetical protein